MVTLTPAIVTLAVAGVLAVAAALRSEADLSALDLGYVAFVTLTFMFFVVTLAGWKDREKQPWWVDIALPNAIVLGTVVQLLALA